jgi:hypothetical protein
MDALRLREALRQTRLELLSHIRHLCEGEAERIVELWLALRITIYGGVVTSYSTVARFALDVLDQHPLLEAPVASWWHCCVAISLAFVHSNPRRTIALLAERFRFVCDLSLRRLSVETDTAA